MYLHWCCICLFFYPPLFPSIRAWSCLRFCLVTSITFKMACYVNIFRGYLIWNNCTLCTKFYTCSAAWQTGSVVSPPLQSPMMTNTALLLMRLHDNGWCPGFQELSQSHSPPWWFSTWFVSIFYPVGQDNTSGCPFTLNSRVLSFPLMDFLCWGGSVSCRWVAAVEPLCVLCGLATILSPPQIPWIRAD